MERNIAVVGCGYWGKNLVRNFAELGAMHTICDAEPKVLEQLASRYPQVNAETEYRRVLSNDEIKGVVIASPAALHYSMAKEALLEGKDTPMGGDFIRRLPTEKKKDDRDIMRGKAPQDIFLGAG